MRAPVGCRTRAFEERGRFSRFCGESADRQVGESRFESLQVKNDKRKANRTQLKENLIPQLPSGVANLFVLESSPGEQE